jgi:hypothetical protein
MVPDRLWYQYHTDCVVRGCPISCTGPASCPAEVVGSCRLGGIAYVYDSYPIDVFHLNFNILCLLLLYSYVSIPEAKILSIE